MLNTLLPTTKASVNAEIISQCQLDNELWDNNLKNKTSKANINLKNRLLRVITENFVARLVTLSVKVDIGIIDIIFRKVR